MSEKKEISPGGITAMVTPFKPDGSIDWEGLLLNIEFQVAQEITGVLGAGTTAESPTLSSEEHIAVISEIASFVRGRIFVLGGGGSNSTKEMLHYVDMIVKCGCGGALLVDPYYNGPSSLEIRDEYYGPAAERFPETIIIPYPIPGRTGCLISATDLAILSNRYANIKAVKEATGDWEKISERMTFLRKYAPADFLIFSGDDDKTYNMMSSPEIMGNGVFSVISNIAPAAVQAMCMKTLSGDTEEAERIKDALKPLFGLVTVNFSRREWFTKTSILREENDKFRNPLPIKTMMQGLGMPAGPCRRPLGKMSFGAVSKVRSVLKEVWQDNPWVLKPIEDFYKVDIADRLADDKPWEALSY